MQMNAVTAEKHQLAAELASLKAAIAHLNNACKIIDAIMQMYDYTVWRQSSDRDSPRNNVIFASRDSSDGLACSFRVHAACSHAVYYSAQHGCYS